MTNIHSTTNNPEATNIPYVDQNKTKAHGMTHLYLVEKNQHAEHIVVSFQNILDGMVDLYLMEKNDIDINYVYR